MATPAQTLAQIAAKVVTLTGASRCASDFLVDRETIAQGANKYQLRGAVSGLPENSNDARPRLYVRLDVHHRLGVGEAERDYTEDEMLAYMQSLLSPAWWRITSYVHDLVEDPSLNTGDVTRIGNVISFIVTVALTVE